MFMMMMISITWTAISHSNHYALVLMSNLDLSYSYIFNVIVSSTFYKLHLIGLKMARDVAEIKHVIYTSCV
jgi:hypothetical protein